MRNMQLIVLILSVFILPNVWAKDVDKAKLELGDKTSEATLVKADENTAKTAAEREKKRAEEIFALLKSKKAETEKNIEISKQKIAEYNKLKSEQSQVLLDLNNQISQLKTDNEKAIKVTKENELKIGELLKARADLNAKIKADQKVYSLTKKKLSKVEASHRKEKARVDSLTKSYEKLTKQKNDEDKKYESTKKQVEENIAKYDQTRIELKAKSEALQEQINEIKAKGIDLKKKEIEVKNNRDLQNKEYKSLATYFKKLKVVEAQMAKQSKKEETSKN